MSENILDFYKLKTEREQAEINQPYRKIIDSKMDRARQVSDKIILNKVYIVSLWGKIIKEFLENKDKEVLIKNLTEYFNMYSIKYNIDEIIYENIYIQGLIDNVEDKKNVKLYMNFIDGLIKEEIVLTKEHERSYITNKIYNENSLVLEELKDLKKIFNLEDFKKLFSYGFEVQARTLEHIMDNYIDKNNEVILQDNIKSLYDFL